MRPASSWTRPSSIWAAPGYLRDGEILSDATLDELRAYDAILLGAVGTPEVPPGVIERGLLLKMRFELDLYVNQRPFLGTAPGHIGAARLRRDPREHRGAVRGRGRGAAQGHLERGRHAGSVNTRMGVERCVRYAFELAQHAANAARHVGSQDERVDLRRRPVGAHVQRGRCGVSRRRRRRTTTSTRRASTSCKTHTATTWS